VAVAAAKMRLVTAATVESAAEAAAQLVLARKGSAAARP
jgi:hypothetical protein